MHTPLKSIILFLLSALLGAFGQYLYKEGSQEVSRNPILWVTNWKILLAVGLYILVMLLFVYAFKIGGELTVLYPVYATTFIWALFIGVFILKEPINLYKIAGVGFIILGVFLIAK